MNNKELKALFSGLNESKQESYHSESRVLLVDSMNTFLRAFVMIKHTNRHGHHIGGLTGYLKSIGFVIRNVKPTRVILVFDGLGGSTAKRNLYPDYKGNRKLTRITNWEGFDSKDDEADAITNEVIRLIDYLKCLPVDLLVIDKVEADDVIGYLANKLDGEVYIMSSDNDYLQLVNDKVTLYSSVKKKFYRPETVHKELGISPQNYINYKVLAGDNSDHVPGVRGLGIKKIMKMFPEFKEDTRYDLKYILEKSKERQGKLYESILQFQKQLEINELLMNLHSPLISEVDIQNIQETLENPKRTMDTLGFIKLYNGDELGNSINNPQMWLYDTFNYLKAFKQQ